MTSQILERVFISHAEQQKINEVNVNVLPGINLYCLSLPDTANATVTAGFRCPPLTPWLTYTPSMIATAQPQLTEN